MRRVEDPRLIQGLGRYADDVSLVRQAYAVVVRSPHAIHSPEGFVFRVFHIRCCRYLHAAAKEREGRRALPVLAKPEPPRDRLLLLRQAFADASPRCRRILVTHYVLGHSLDETARILSLQPASIRKTISRWLAKVQKRVHKLVEKGLARDHGFNRREVTEAIQLAAEEMNHSVREYLFDASERNEDKPAKSAGSGVVQH